MPYAEIFRPQYIYLISMKPVPQHVKEYLLKYGVTVVDEAYPGGRGKYEVTRLIDHLI